MCTHNQCFTAKKTKKNIIFHLKIVIFTAVKYCCILHGRVCVMYGPKYAASNKNEKLFVADFSDFYLAVSAPKNDAKHLTSNSFITPMTRDMGQIMLPAEKRKTFYRRFF